MSWRQRRGPMLARFRRIGLVAAGAAVAVWAGLHASSGGASWSSAWQLIAHLRWQWLVGRGGGWFAGLCGRRGVLTGAVAGLSRASLGAGSDPRVDGCGQPAVGGHRPARAPPMGGAERRHGLLLAVAGCAVVVVPDGGRPASGCAGGLRRPSRRTIADLVRP